MVMDLPSIMLELQSDLVLVLSVMFVVGICQMIVDMKGGD